MLFRSIGYFNGIGMTRFVMLQGIVSAFCVRVPVSYLMSRRVPVSLFWIGMATPFSSMPQIAMCTWYFLSLRRQGLLRLREKG